MVELTITRPSFISSFESLADGKVISFCFADGLVELRSSFDLQLLVSVGNTSIPPILSSPRNPTAATRREDSVGLSERAVPTLTISSSPNEALFVTVDWFGMVKIYSLLGHLINVLLPGEDEQGSNAETFLSQKFIDALLLKTDWWDLVLYTQKLVRERKSSSEPNSLHQTPSF